MTAVVEAMHAYTECVTAGQTVAYRCARCGMTADGTDEGRDEIVAHLRDHDEHGACCPCGRCEVIHGTKGRAA